MPCSSLVVLGSVDGFNALLSTLFIVTMKRYSWSLAFYSSPGVPLRTFYDFDKNKLL
jgi:hypothetical protein